MSEYVCSKCGSRKTVEEGEDTPVCCDAPMALETTESSSETNTEENSN